MTLARSKVGQFKCTGTCHIFHNNNKRMKMITYRSAPLTYAGSFLQITTRPLKYRWRALIVRIICRLWNNENTDTEYNV